MFIILIILSEICFEFKTLGLSLWESALCNFHFCTKQQTANRTSANWAYSGLFDSQLPNSIKILFWINCLKVSYFGRQIAFNAKFFGHFSYGCICVKTKGDLWQKKFCKRNCIYEAPRSLLNAFNQVRQPCSTFYTSFDSNPAFMRYIPALKKFGYHNQNFMICSSCRIVELNQSNPEYPLGVWFVTWD